jgi:hypothetical protein
MEAHLTMAQELLDDRHAKLEKFEARVSKRLEEERCIAAQKLADDRKALHAEYCKRTQQCGDRYT